MSSSTPSTWTWAGSPDPAQARALAEFLRRKYADVKIDAIITVYPSAVDFLLGEQGTLFPGVPIVAAEVIRGYAGNLERSPGPAAHHRHRHGRQYLPGCWTPPFG